MEINAKHIGEIIAKQIEANIPGLKIEIHDRTVEITCDEAWYKNRAIFMNYCGEHMLYIHFWNNNSQEWEESTEMKCNKFLNNPVFWAGYIAGELMNNHRT